MRRSTNPLTEGRTQAAVVRAYQGGDKSAGSALLAANEGLIRAVARPYLRIRVDKDDLLQEARMGFLRALDDFDPSRGTALSTYAAWWIKQRVRLHVATTRGSVRVPVGVQQAVRRARKAGTEPTGEIARYAATLSTTAASLDATIGDGGATWLDWLADERVTEEEISAAEERRLAAALLDQAMTLARLKPRAREVLMRRMADDPETLEAIGDDLGVTREGVRQIEARALEKLRKALKEMGVRRWGG